MILRRCLHETRVDSFRDEFIPATIEMTSPVYITEVRNAQIFCLEPKRPGLTLHKILGECKVRKVSKSLPEQGIKRCILRHILHF